MAPDVLPTVAELATGAFLHDVGKLFQRAMGMVRSLPEQVRNLDSTLLPPDGHGGYGYKHVLFTEWLFHDLESRGARLPDGLRLPLVRDAAVWHHKPESGPAWAEVVAVADRISAGMDRKRRDEEAERADEPRGWDAFRKVPLAWLLDRVRLRSERAGSEHAVAPGPLTPDSLFPVPRSSLDGAAVIAGYRAAADGFRADLGNLLETHAREPGLFLEGLLALSERWLWAIASSTMDEPDVALHDHSHSVAAFATCLFVHHQERGDLADRAAIRATDRLKLRLLEADLSGIQTTLFRFAAQQVQGANRILRGRSFLVGSLIEAATLMVLRELDLPPFVVLQRAGGKARMLLPELDDIENRIEVLQARLDAWLARTYAGDLALHLALGPALAPQDFGRKQMRATLDRLRRVVEARKQRPLASFLVANGPILATDYEEGAAGACSACGVRPARDEGRCPACAAEHDYGRLLPKAQAALWLPVDSTAATDSFCPFNAFRLVLSDTPRPGPGVLSAWRFADSDAAWPFARRFVADYVPRMTVELRSDRRFEGLSEEAVEVEPGEMLLFEQIGALAKEPDGNGRAMLAVLKADVDRLGQAFARGFGDDHTIGRTVALSRLMDAFFTGWLPARLARDFPETYTVYAGGDDLLLIGPWHRMVDLARVLRDDFTRFAGDNPDLTLSAGIELLDIREPLNRAAHRAEERLEAAKHAGRDRVCLLEPTPLRWSELPDLLRLADWLDGLIREGKVSTAWLYKLLRFADEKAKADAGETAFAGWRARYRYHLARTFKDDQAMHERFHELMGLAGREVPTRTVLSMALWRHR